MSLISPSKADGRIDQDSAVRDIARRAIHCRNRVIQAVIIEFDPNKEIIRDFGHRSKSGKQTRAR